MILEALDLPFRPFFGCDDVAGLPDGTLAGLTAAGLLTAAQYARSIACDGCGEGCHEEVELVACEDGEPPRAWVICHGEESLGRVPVELDRVRQWTVDTAALVGLLAQELGSSRSVQECVPERLWWLGRPFLAGQRMDVFLALGATWRDAGEVFGGVGRLRECARPLVLVPSRVTCPETFGAAAQVQSLARLLSIEDGALQLDVHALAEVVFPACQEPSTPGRPRLVIGPTSVEFDGQLIILGEYPLKLLRTLAGERGRPLAAGDIAVALWGDGGEYYLDQVRQHASAINKAVRNALPEQFPKGAQLVKGLRNVGYHLTWPPNEVLVA